MLLKLIIAPLIVGAIIALFSFGLPFFFEKKNELSYSVDEPIINLDKKTMGDVDIKINNLSTRLLVGQTVHIWNSGQVPIEKLPITYMFRNIGYKFSDTCNYTQY